MFSLPLSFSRSSNAQLFPGGELDSFAAPQLKEDDSANGTLNIAFLYHRRHLRYFPRQPTSSSAMLVLIEFHSNIIS